MLPTVILHQAPKTSLSPSTRPTEISCDSEHNPKYRDSPPFTSSDTKDLIMKSSSLDYVSDDIVQYHVHYDDYIVMKI